MSRVPHPDTNPSPTRDPQRDTHLAHAVRAGDGDALKTLFRTYYNELIAYAVSVVQDDAVAEDVVQEVFLRIWDLGAAWTPEGDGVIRYLYGAVRHRAIDMIRIDRRRAAILAFHSDAGVGMLAPKGTTELEASELAAVVQRAIDALPTKRREVFVLSRQRRLAQREIAELLGITVNTVNAHLAKALQSIRDAVDAF